MSPRYYNDWEEFQRYCWWWHEITAWMEENYPVGWHFKEAWDVDRDAKSYLVVFRPTLPGKDKFISFDRSAGSLKVSEGK